MDRHISAPVGRETAEELRQEIMYILQARYIQRVMLRISGCTKRFVREETYLLI